MLRKILILLLLSTMTGYAQDNSGIRPSCFEVSILPEHQPYELENTDQYIVCKDQRVTITPTLRAPLRATDTYNVEEISYDENKWPLTGGTDIQFNTVDQRASSGDITLPFKFCYFGATWDKISVHSNGYISFTDGVRFKGNTPTGGNDPSDLIPTTNAGLLNTVMLFKHTHWQTGGRGRIFYEVFGDAPCRVFVVTYFDHLAYQLNPNLCDPALIPGQTHQIAFHETTNFIDIIVTQHNGCPLNPAQGSAVLGINNATGSSGYSPPGMNLGVFDVKERAFRFAPSGEDMYRFEWLVDGVVVSNTSAPLTVDIDKAKIVTAKLYAETCEEEYFDKYEIRLRSAIDLDVIELDRLIVCDKNQDTYDLNELSQMIKDSQPDVDPAELNKLKFYYYPTEDDAYNKTNQITQPRQYPIQMGENVLYVRVETELEDCFEMAKAIIIKAPVEVKVPSNVNLCTTYTLPPLTDDEFYYKLERLDEDANYIVETLPEPFEGQVIDRVGFYKVSIKKTNEYGCEDVKSFILFVENCSYPRGISPNGDGENDLLDLTYNNVVELKIFNRYGKVVYEHGIGYKRQWMGQDSNGNLLPSGTYFLHVKTKNYEYQDWIQLMQELKQ